MTSTIAPMIERIEERIRLAGRTTLSTKLFQGFEEASVLMPIVGNKDVLSFLLTLRTEEVESHKGQISFPGGVRESHDADPTATALREAEEELGLLPDSVRILGTLDQYPVPSGFIITPVVGYLPDLPTLRPHSREVAEVFTVPLDFFRNRSNGRLEFRTLRGQTVPIWFFQYGPHLIWGATATMIMRLLDIIDDPGTDK